ncbi:MAG: hypothetical protein HC804_07975 [Anaerolineae bacterium]|nr:hypothetical protein [Anaerolineae bacterium]
MDTQWPRYEVFKQDRPGQPHESIGTVHAVDAEMALQNGRDLFARRPKCHSLWVARADAIFSKTAEQLAAEQLAADNSWQSDAAAATSPETYLVFQKQTERRGMTYTTHVGEVEASSPAHACNKPLPPSRRNRCLCGGCVRQRPSPAAKKPTQPPYFPPPQTNSTAYPTNTAPSLPCRKLKEREKSN